MKQNRKIRILFNAFADENIFCAQDLNARDIASRLDTNKYVSYLFRTSKNKISGKLENKPNVRFINIPRRNRLRVPRAIIVLLAMLSGKYDIIISGKVDWVSVAYLYLRNTLGTKSKFIHTVEILRPSPFASARYNNTARNIALRADATYAISTMIGERAKTWCGKRLNLMHAVGVDTEVFKPLLFQNTGKSRKTVLCCGTLSERKQPHVFLEFAARYPGYDFIWVGEGPLGQGLLDAVKTRRIKNFVIRGNIPHFALATVMKEADVFVLPSLNEGFPKVVIEAMACGLPAIALASYGPEAIIDGESGYVVETVDRMYDELGSLLEDDALLMRMKEAARQRSREFSWDRIVENYEGAIDRLLKPRYGY